MDREARATVESLCLEALAKDAGERAAFLDEACGADADLRREVESLLAGRAEADGMLQTPAPTARAAPLTPGTRLGPYEVQSFIGAGGMGQVYKAHDTRLGRTVAIKVLPPDLAAHPDRRRRFEQEARAASALNDPHICTLHDIGSASVVSVGSGLPFDSAHGRQGETTPPRTVTVDYLVMEYLDGETLAARLRKGRLSLQQALECATQIAEALSKAHRQGIVHRDLTPGNVMLTKSGAKLLDFGLAKLRPAALGAASATRSAVSTLEPSTAPGVLLGTVPYMAPEQLEGKEADARSDIFSFGTVLYEMVTGKRAFEGESHASVIAAILEREPPPLSSLQPVTPPALDRVVRKCLHKDPDRRWQNASDLADECCWLLDRPAETSGRPAARRIRLAQTAPWLAALGFAAIAAAGVLRGTTTPTLVERLSLTVQGLVPERVAVSPDGRSCLFSAKSEEGQRLFLRRFEDFTVTPLVGTDDATDACFSPDGQAIIFASARGLQRMLLSGGAPVPIPNTNEVSTGTYPSIFCTATGGVVFPRFEEDSGLWQASPEHGWKPEALKLTGDTAVRYLHPQVLPGGKAILFTIHKQGSASIAALRLDDKTVHSVLDNMNATRGRYIAATRDLVYQAKGQLFGVAFDLDSLDIQGNPKPVEEQVGNTDVLRPEFDVSSSGTLAYLPPTDVRLFWVERNGGRRMVRLDAQAQKVTRAAAAVWVAVSPDGSRAVLGLATEQGRRLWVATNLEGDAALTRLTPGDDDYYGSFTPDSQNVLFTSGSAGGGYNIYSARADAGGSPVQVTTGPGWRAATSVRRDPAGDIFLFNDLQRGVSDIWQQRLGHPESAKGVVRGRKHEVGARFSPDGHWIAYCSNESGQSEIYVMGYPEGPKHQISPNGGTIVRWNPSDARELFYENGTAIFAAHIVNGARAGEPRRLFEITRYGARNWDVAPGGERFLIAESTRPAEIRIVRNWFQELKTKVSARK